MEGMFLKLLDEIERCVDQELYIAALTLVLTVPDICGKVAYPEIGKSSKKRYIKWYDENIGKYENPKAPSKEFEEMPYTSGELLYSLRCHMLHEGMPEVDNESIKEDRCKVDHFEIEIESFTMGGCSHVSIAMDGTVSDRTLTVNLLNLCFKICQTARGYYMDNKEQFNTFDYRFIDRRSESIANVDIDLVLDQLGETI